MKITLNQRELDLLPGMTVRHALIAADLIRYVNQGKEVRDEWGNVLGLEGVLHEGMKISVPEPG